MKTIAFSRLASLDSLARLQLLARHGMLVVTSTPLEDEVILGLARSLGLISGEDREASARRNRGIGGIDIVRPLDPPLKDPFGNIILSTTRAPFALHTDQFFLEEPADIVMLLCCETDGRGGDSVVANVRSVVAGMPSDSVRSLMEPFVRVPFGLTSVLRATPTGWQVAYNRYEIDKMAITLAHSYSASQLAILDSFEKHAARAAIQLPLAQGDCLLLDNRTVLHGRTAIRPDSSRLLKRLRVSLAR